MTVPATAEHLGDLHRALGRFWSQVARRLAAPPTPTWRASFDTAIGELASNIVRHAYRGGTSAGSMRLHLRAYAERMEASVTDRGAPFREPEPSAMATPAATGGLGRPARSDGLSDGLGEPFQLDDDAIDRLLALRESGYGLDLIRASVDHVRYTRSRRGMNEWLLLKRFRPAVDGRVFLDALASVAGATNPDQAIEALLRAVVAVLDGHAVVYVLDPTGVAAGHWRRIDAAERAGNGAAGALAQGTEHLTFECTAARLVAGEPVVLVNDYAAVELRSDADSVLMRRHGIHSALHVGIDGGGRRFGTLHVFHPIPRAFGAAEAVAAQSLAAQAGAVFDRAGVAAAAPRG